MLDSVQSRTVVLIDSLDMHYKIATK